MRLFPRVSASNVNEIRSNHAHAARFEPRSRRRKVPEVWSKSLHRLRYVCRCWFTVSTAEENWYHNEHFCSNCCSHIRRTYHRAILYSHLSLSFTPFSSASLSTSSWRKHLALYLLSSGVKDGKHLDKSLNICMKNWRAAHPAPLLPTAQRAL